MMAEDIRVIVRRVPKAPERRPLAQHILEQVLASLGDPEDEKEYQAWKKAREEKGA